MAIHGYNNFSQFVNDLIDGKVDGNFDPSATSYDYELNIDNFSGAAFNGLESMRDEFWEDLLKYMYNEETQLGDHVIIRDDDWGELESNKNTVFQYINNHADLDDGADAVFYTREEFEDLINVYNSTIKKYILEYSNVEDAYEAYRVDQGYTGEALTEDEWESFRQVYEDNHLDTAGDYESYCTSAESAGLTPISEEEFNYAVAAYAYDSYEDYLTVYSSQNTFMSQEDFELAISLYDTYGSYENYITDYIEPLYFSYISNYIAEGDPHWNESLAALVDFYQKYFDDTDPLDDIEYNLNGTVANSNGNINMGDNYVEFRTDDIIHGDAGNYFARIDDAVVGTYNDIAVVVNEDYAASYQKDVEPEKDEDGIYRTNKKKTWVRPWFNIDGSTYGIERGRDKIKRVLNDNRNLQFTRYMENEQDYINDKLLGYITDYWPDANGDNKLTTDGAYTDDEYRPIDAMICNIIFAWTAAGVNEDSKIITFEDRYGNIQKIDIVSAVEGLKENYSSTLADMGYNIYNYILKSIDNVNVKYYDNDSIYDDTASSIDNSDNFYEFVNNGDWRVYTQNWLSFLYIELSQDDKDMGPLEEASLIVAFYNEIQKGNYEDTKEDWLKFLRNERIKKALGKDELVETLEKYLRLIMPMYERIVEVEDLDRNFWVIAQVLGGISAYVLGDDSPIGDMFAGLADEVVQLWENVLYLWVAMGLISQESYYTDIKKLFIPVYNSEIEPCVKFDHFTEWSSDAVYATGLTAETYCSTILKTIWEENKNIEILKDEYNESNLVIVPEVRQKNYYDNYYAQVIYPGLIIYNRNSKETHYVCFYCKKTYSSTEYTTPVYIDLSNENEQIREYLVGFQEDEVYYSFSSFQEPSVLEELYRAAIRTTLDLDVSINSSYEIQVDFSNFSLNFYDVARELADESDCLAGTATTSTGNIAITEDKVLSFDFNVNSLNDITKEVQKTRGYYLGEVVSYLNLKKFEVDSLELEAITYNPQEGYSDAGISSVSLSSIGDYIDYIDGTGKTSWKTIVENAATSELTESGMAKLYYCISGYITSEASRTTFEMKPYMTIAVNKGENIYYYHFLQKVVDNGLNSSITYPYISSIYEGEGSVENESIGKLCLFSQLDSGAGLEYSSNNYEYTGGTEVFFIEPQSQRYYTSEDRTLNTVGISIYGNMGLFYSDYCFYLKNYAIIMIDRCRLSTTSALNSVPYYYLCKVKTVPDEGEWGEISCSYKESGKSISNCYSNTESDSFYTLSNLGTSSATTLTKYYWNTEWQGEKYMNNYHDYGDNAIGEYLNYSSEFRDTFESEVTGIDFNEYRKAGGV